MTKFLLVFVLLVQIFFIHAGFTNCVHLEVTLEYIDLSEAVDSQFEDNVRQLTHCEGKICETKCNKICGLESNNVNSAHLDMTHFLKNKLNNDVWKAVCEFSYGDIFSYKRKPTERFFKKLISTIQGIKTPAEFSNLGSSQQIVNALILENKEPFGVASGPLFNSIYYYFLGFEEFYRYQSSLRDFSFSSFETVFNAFASKNGNLIKSSLSRRSLAQIKVKTEFLQKKFHGRSFPQGEDPFVLHPAGATLAFGISSMKIEAIKKFFTKKIKSGTQSFCSVDDIFNFHSKIQKVSTSGSSLKLSALSKKYKDIIAVAAVYLNSIKELVSALTIIRRDLNIIPKDLQTFFISMKTEFLQKGIEKQKLATLYSSLAKNPDALRKYLKGKKNEYKKIANDYRMRLKSKSLTLTQRLRLGLLLKKILRALNVTRMAKKTVSNSTWLSVLKTIESINIEQQQNRSIKKGFSFTSSNLRKKLTEMKKTVNEKFRPAIENFNKLAQFADKKSLAGMVIDQRMHKRAIHYIQRYIVNLWELYNKSRTTIIHTGLFSDLSSRLKFHTEKVTLIIQRSLRITDEITEFVQEIRRQEKGIQNNVSKYFAQNILKDRLNRQKWVKDLSNLYRRSAVVCGCPKK